MVAGGYTPPVGYTPGSWSLTKTGAGTLELDGDNSFTGGVTIDGGTLSVGHNNALGSGTLTVLGSTLDIQNGIAVGNATDLRNDLDINVGAGATGTHAGIIFETGGSFGITKVGAGTLILSGANTYTGATNVNAGTLQAGAANTFSPFSAFNVAAGAILDLNNLSQTVGSLAGAGIVNLVTATLTAGGDNTSTTFSGAMSGAGGLTKVGAGTLILSGASNYTGATNVNGGILNVNGSLVSTVNLNGGATLMGNGAIGGLVVNGGTLAPGNSIGIITVNGNLTFNGGVYQVEVSPAEADRTNVAGTATLAGTVQAVFLPGSYVQRSYTILSAAGGRGGTQFGALTTTNLPAGFRAGLDYTANDVLLVLTGQLGTGAALNGNQGNVATALNNFFNAGGALPPGFVSVFGLTGTALVNALTQLSGEVAAGFQPASHLSMGLFLNAMLDPFVGGRNRGFGAAAAYAPERQSRGRAQDAFAAAMPVKAQPQAPTFEQRWSVWGTAYGGRTRTDGDAATGSSDMTDSAAGFTAGADYKVSPALTLGAAVAIGETRWNVASLGSGNSNLAQVGGYAAAQWNAFYLSAALAGAWHNAETERTVNVAGLERLEADFDATVLGARLEGGWRHDIGRFGLIPHAAVQVQSVHTSGYGERATLGPGTFALAYASQTVTDTRSELGLWADTAHRLANGAVLTLRARAAWMHDFDPQTRVNAVFQALPGSNFTVEGAASARDAALVSAAGELQLVNGVTLLARFDGEFSGRANTYAGTGTVRYQW